MARKKKKAPEGAPEWMVTYGDMMTLLMCFFVMIVAMSEIKKDDKFKKVVDSIQRQFGYNSGIGIAPTDQPADVSPTVVEMATADENKDLTKGLSNEDGQVGDRDLVERIYPGRRYVVGAAIRFAPGSAALQPSAYEPLLRIAAKIRGLRHRVELRGHTSAVPLPADSEHKDHMQLSLARAIAIREWMIGSAEDRGRIDTRRIVVVGVDKYEPLRARAYEAEQWAKNDRVDVIMDETLVTDFQGEPAEEISLRQWNDGPLGETHAAGE